MCFLHHTPQQTEPVHLTSYIHKCLDHALHPYSSHFVNSHTHTYLSILLHAAPSPTEISRDTPPAKNVYQVNVPTNSISATSQTEKNTSKSTSPVFLPPPTQEPSSDIPPANTLPMTSKLFYHAINPARPPGSRLPTDPRRAHTPHHHHFYSSDRLCWQSHILLCTGSDYSDYPTYFNFLLLPPPVSHFHTELRNTSRNPVSHLSFLLVTYRTLNTSLPPYVWHLALSPILSPPPTLPHFFNTSRSFTVVATSPALLHLHPF